MEYYGIWAVRSGGSVMGHAEAWSKRDGVPEVFTSKAEAEAQAGQYNKSTASVHVRYFVKEMEPELAKSALRAQEKAAAAQKRAEMLDVIGQFEKSRNLSDRNSMTWFHNDFGEFRAKPGVTDEQIAARYGEVLEMKLEREQKRSAAAVPDNVHGYTVTQSVCFSNDRGFALAENPRAASPFVTWQFTEENGKREYYWGHYFSKEASAANDYDKRVNEYRVDYPTLTEKYFYLAAAEMSTEQNYNMIDGAINNLPPARADLTDGQTYEEIRELAPETLPGEKPSVTEKLEAAKRAVKDAPKKQPREKKPSELERG